MHKCLTKVENRNLELLEVYKKNYTQSIVFNENNLRNFLLSQKSTTDHGKSAVRQKGHEYEVR